jgi:hypothetical protein
VSVVINGGSNLSRRLEGIVDQGFLDNGRIIPLEPITDVRPAEFEDLFYPEDYVVIYNATFQSTLSIDQLAGAEDSIIDRIRRVEGDFNRSDPSNWILRNRKTASFVLRPITLDRFERLFVVINDTLA